MIEGIVLDHNASVGGTSLRGEISASFAELLMLLGEPNGGPSGDGKVSTEWICKCGDKVFTLYDYKETALYDPDLPTVEEFRALPSYSWHIGGHTSAEPFRSKLAAALANLRCDRKHPPVGIVYEHREDFAAYFRYEPGNGTRYEVVLVDVAALVPGKRQVSITLTNMGRGCAVPSDCGDVEYLAEKLRMNEADARPLLDLLRYFCGGSAENPSRATADNEPASWRAAEGRGENPFKGLK